MKKTLFTVMVAMVLFVGWAYNKLIKKRTRNCKLTMKKRLSQQ